MDEIKGFFEYSSNDEIYEKASDFADKFSGFISDFNTVFDSSQINHSELLSDIKNYIDSLDFTEHPELKDELADSYNRYKDLVDKLNQGILEKRPLSSTSGSYSSGSSGSSLDFTINSNKIIKRF